MTAGFQEFAGYPLKRMEKCNLGSRLHAHSTQFSQPSTFTMLMVSVRSAVTKNEVSLAWKLETSGPNGS